MEVTVGIEPTNNGFANRAISHSGTSPRIEGLPFGYQGFRVLVNEGGVETRQNHYTYLMQKIHSE